MIAGHQRLISPFLTRNHETGLSYGSICSIYPVRFAVSDAAVAHMTRDDGPAATGTSTRSLVVTGVQTCALPICGHQAGADYGSICSIYPVRFAGSRTTVALLTRNPETGIEYGSICSIYPVRFVVSGGTVALMTRDHGPSATGSFTRSGRFAATTVGWPAEVRNIR